jgi:NAD(P)-dependent dehydrogenase (short-subunit alcohol dehydrogenase family)
MFYMFGCDLTGKTVVVTGGYSGIGVETVRAFRSAGAKVVVPLRTMTIGKQTDEVEAQRILDRACRRWNQLHRYG